MHTLGHTPCFWRHSSPEEQRQLKTWRKHKEHVGLKCNPVTALSQSPPGSEDVFAVGFRWILSPTHLAGASMCWCCPCLQGCVSASATEWLLFPEKHSLAISISSWMKIGKQNEAVFGGWLGGREGTTSAFAHLWIPKLGGAMSACFLSLFAVTKENICILKMQPHRLFTHKTSTPDTKSNRCTCTVSTIPQKLFRMCPVPWIHNAQVAPAANPCLHLTAGTVCDSKQDCD